MQRNIYRVDVTVEQQTTMDSLKAIGWSVAYITPRSRAMGDIVPRAPRPVGEHGEKSMLFSDSRAEVLAVTVGAAYCNSSAG